MLTCYFKVSAINPVVDPDAANVAGVGPVRPPQQTCCSSARSAFLEYLAHCIVTGTFIVATGDDTGHQSCLQDPLELVDITDVADEKVLCSLVWTALGGYRIRYKFT